MDETLYRRRIHDLLTAQSVLTLSMCDAEGPWSIPVYYAADNLKLVIASRLDSRHSRAAFEGLAFAASVFAPTDNWRKLGGLQMSGQLIGCEKENTQNSMDVYTEKFPFTKLLFAQSAEELGMETGEMQFFIFSPKRIVLTDNTVHFGFKWEYLP